MSEEKNVLKNAAERHSRYPGVNAEPPSLDDIEAEGHDEVVFTLKTPAAPS